MKIEFELSKTQLSLFRRIAVAAGLIGFGGAAHAFIGDSSGQGDISWIKRTGQISSTSLKGNLVDLQSQMDAKFSSFSYFSTRGVRPFALPTNIKQIYVELSGGGGGGGGGDFGSAQLHGGGQGGWGEVRAGFLTVPPGSSISVVVGAGGSHGLGTGGISSLPSSQGVGSVGSISQVIVTSDSLITAAGGLGGNTGGPGSGGPGTGGPSTAGGVQISSRKGQSSLPIIAGIFASINDPGQSTLPGATCSGAPGEGGCGGGVGTNGAHNGVPYSGEDGADGYVKIWY